MQANAPRTTPESPPASKLCIECKFGIHPEAKKCVHCQSRQDWRRFFDFSSTILSLLIALLSVLGLSMASIVGALSDVDAKVRVNLLATRVDHLRYGDKAMRSLVATIWVTNGGKLPGAVKSVSLRLPSSPDWDPNIVIMDKAREGQPITVAWTTSIIAPGESRILDVYYPTEKPEGEFPRVRMLVETVRFDGRTSSLEVRR